MDNNILSVRDVKIVDILYETLFDETCEAARRLTQQRCNAFGDGVRHTEGQQQDADDRGGQSTHDEMEVNVPYTVGIHLQERDGLFDFIPTPVWFFFAYASVKKLFEMCLSG